MPSRMQRMVSELFGCGETDLPPLDDLLRDPGCWSLADDLEGLSVVRFPSTAPGRTTLYLARARAGATLPPHVQEGRRTVLVLQGGFRDEHGRQVRAGDRLVIEAGTERLIEIDDAADCICASRVEFDDGRRRGARDAGLRPLALVPAH